MIRFAKTEFFFFFKKATASVLFLYITYVVETKSIYTEMLSFYHALGLEKSEFSTDNIHPTR